MEKVIQQSNGNSISGIPRRTPDLHAKQLIDLRRRETDVKKLKSELGAVAELLIDPKRWDNTREIKHLEVTRDLMASLGIANVSDAVLLGMKGTVTMERLLTENEREKIAEGEAIGEARGRAEGKAEAKAETVLKLMQKMNMTSSEAFTFLEIPEEEQEAVQQQLQLIA